MGFMDDLKESAKFAQGGSDKKESGAGLPSDYEPELKQESDRHSNLDNPQAYEPIKLATTQSNTTNKISNTVKTVLIVGACFAIIAVLRPSRTVPNSELPAAPQPPTHTIISSVSQQPAPAQPIANVDDKGGDWYAIQNGTGKCIKDEGPAEMMKNLKTLGQPYQVKEDVVEGNRPMQVRLILNDGFESGQIIYYRGESRCQAAANQKQQSTDAELNRYK